MLIFTSRKARRPCRNAQTPLARPPLSLSLGPIQLVTFLLLQLALITRSCAEGESPSRRLSIRSSCSLYKEVGPNDLSINDIVVKNEANIACIKARFSLAIKVEAPATNPIMLNQQQTNNNSPGNSQEGNERIVLGYLPLDTVVAVDDNCPSSYSEPNKDSHNNNNNNNVDGNVDGNGNNHADSNGHLNEEKPVNELEMIVSFECGKLAFHFKRENNYYLSAIKGVVNLDSNTVREFYAEQNMLFTSDLYHHFKFNDLVEVNSTAKTKGFYYLAANFYNLEFETFRNTSSRSFIRPADDDSKPFLEGQ